MKQLKSHLITAAIAYIGLSLPLSASPVDQTKAYRIASRYIKVNAQQAQQLRSNSVSPYYIIKGEGGKGFAIISGESDLGEIIGYSDTNDINLDRLSPELQFFLKAFEDKYQRHQRGELKQEELRSLYRYVDPYPRNIGPLLKTEWGQTYPYNATFPDKVYAPTGCVATATAQIMNYHQWPKVGKGKHSYVPLTLEIELSADFSKSHYDWDNMLPKYIGWDYSKNNWITSTQKESTAVSQLMWDIGVACNMGYSKNSSGALSYMVVRAATKYFSYDAEYLSQADDGMYHIRKTILKELQQGYPVFMSGFTSSSGHAWVVDGYDHKQDLYHINWGWDGAANGFYNIGVLDPERNDFGATRSSAFNSKIEVITLHPNKNGSTPKVYENKFSMGSEGTLLLASKQESEPRQDNLSLVLNYLLYDDDQDGFIGDFGLALCDFDDKLIKMYPSKFFNQQGFSQSINNISPGILSGQVFPNSYFDFSLELKGLPNGYYKIIPMSISGSPEKGWGNWVKMKESYPLEIYLGSDKVQVVKNRTNFTQDFRLSTIPELTAPAYEGGKLSVDLVIDNTSARAPISGHIANVYLYDTQGNLVSKLTPTALTDISFYRYTSDGAHVSVLLPQEVKAGRYKVVFEMETEIYSEKKLIPIKPYHLRDFYIDVLPASERSIELTQSIAVDNNGKEIAESVLDLKKYPELSFKVEVANKNQTAYQGKVHFSLRDMDKELIYPIGSIEQAEVEANGLRNFNSSTIDGQKIKLRNEAVYSLMVEGERNGKRFDLWSPEKDRFFVTILNGVSESEMPEGLPSPKKRLERLAPDGMTSEEDSNVITPEVKPQPNPEVKPQPDSQPEVKPTPQPDDKGESTAIEEVKTLGIELSYTPGTAICLIRSEQPIRVELFDLQGLRLHDEQQQTVGDYSLSIASYQPGIYLLRITTPSGSKVIRLRR